VKRLLAVLLFVTLLFSVVGCSQPQQPPESKGSAESEATVGGDFFIGGGSSGGVYYAMSTTFSQFFNDMGGLGEFTAYPTTGTGQNLAFLKKGDIDFAIIAAPIGADALNGVNSFEGNQYTGLTAIAYLYPTYIQLFAGSGTNIKTINDITGKRVAVGAPGGGDIFMLEKILAPFDMTFDDFKPEYVGAADGIEMMRDGHLDVVPGFTNIPFTSMLELTNAGKAYVIPIEQDAIEKLTTGAKAEFFPLTIPAGTYKGQAEDVNTVGMGTLFCADSKVSEDQVYEMTKTIWENIDELRSRHAAVGNMVLEDIDNIKGVPLHPGAERYYREVGVLK